MGIFAQGRHTLLMTAHPVSTRVSNAGNDGKELTEPVEA